MLNSQEFDMHSFSECVTNSFSNLKQGQSHLSGAVNETTELIHKLDGEIGYTSSLLDEDDKNMHKDEAFSDSFLHMDTGIIQHGSKLELGADMLNDVSCISDSIISEMVDFQYKPEMDILDDSMEVALLKHLAVLDLSCNQLKELSGLVDLALLSDLNIAENMIISLEPLKNLKNLVRLDASKNLLSALDFHNVQYTKLEDAQFSDNKISEVLGIDTLAKLSNLNLNNNEIKSIGINSSMKNLKSVSARNNRLGKVVLNHMPLLEFLDLGENYISFVKIPDETKVLSTILLDRQKSPSLTYDFSNCHNLLVLNLASNHSILNFEGLPRSLVELNVCDCSISEISEYFNLKNLVFLDASNNNIVDVSGLLGCHNIKRLRLFNNQINNLYMMLRIVKKCLHLTDFDARYNPINLGFYSKDIPDDDHLRNSTDECIVKRICYRSLLIHYSNITMLDGIDISLDDRKSSSRHVSKFKKAMHSVSTSDHLFPDWIPDCRPLSMESTSDFFIIIPNL